MDYPFFTASSRLNISIFMPLAPDPLSPDFPSSLYLTRMTPRHYMTVFHSSLARFPMLAGEMQHPYAVVTTHSSRRESTTRRERGAYRSVLLVRALTSSLSPIIYLYHSGPQIRNPIQYLLQ